jgi:hypothetical protein
MAQELENIKAGVETYSKMPFPKKGAFGFVEKQKQEGEALGNKFKSFKERLDAIKSFSIDNLKVQQQKVETDIVARKNVIEEYAKKLNKAKELLDGIDQKNEEAEHFKIQAQGSSGYGATSQWGSLDQKEVE